MPSPRPTARINSKLLEIKKEASNDNLKFIVIGDWGEKGNFYQRPVASAIEKITQTEKIDFILTTGDNFYPDGVSNLQDPHFQESFENIYSSSKKIPWYITLGNHDYMGNIQSLIDYSEKNPFWVLPNTYYAFDKKISRTNKILFLVTDTNEFIHFLDFYYRSYMRKEKGVVQLNWIDTNLKDNTYQWKIVIGHHPIYSAGHHGDTSSLHGKFLDNLEKNQVDLYFAGHEHDLQFLKHPDKKIQFFISGAGSKMREIKSSPYSIFSAPEPGFLVATITEKEILIRFINLDANEIYRTVIKK
jgi:predicted MPP superfamily phosphohydrolase